MRRKQIKPEPPELTEEVAQDLIRIITLMQGIVFPLQGKLENVYQILRRYEDNDRRAAWAAMFVDEAKQGLLTLNGSLDEACDYLFKEDDRYMRRPA